MKRKDLNETEIKTRYTTPAIKNAGLESHNIREEYSITAGRIIPQARGKWTCGKILKADYLLFYKQNLIAVVEAKDNKHQV